MATPSKGVIPDPCAICPSLYCDVVEMSCPEIEAAGWVIAEAKNAEETASVGHVG